MDDSHPKSMSEFLNDNELHNKIKENRFTLFSKNIRSLTKNLIELNFIAQKFEPDVLTVQEIWKPYGPFVTINNYHEIIMNPDDKVRMEAEQQSMYIRETNTKK
jgi:hypothetical protein